jgi:hypothetical protein
MVIVFAVIGYCCLMSLLFVNIVTFFCCYYCWSLSLLFGVIGYCCLLLLFIVVCCYCLLLFAVIVVCCYCCLLLLLFDVEASGDDEEDRPEKLDKMEYKESDVLGEAISSLVVRDDPAK